FERLEPERLDPLRDRLRQAFAAGDEIAAVVVVVQAGEVPPFRFANLTRARHRFAIFDDGIGFRAVPVFADLRTPAALGQHRKGPERQIDAPHFVLDLSHSQIARPKPTILPQPRLESLDGCRGRYGKADHELRRLAV